jgi:hypothetical protein
MVHISSKCGISCTGVKTPLARNVHKFASFCTLFHALFFHRKSAPRQKFVGVVAVEG